MSKELRKWRWKLWLLSVVKIPLIRFVRPRILELSEEGCEILIPLRRRNKNHLNSMYFGALAVGADVAPGLLCFYLAEKHRLKLLFAFKSMKAEFLQRAESAVRFTCRETMKIESAIQEALLNDQRMNVPVHVQAFNNQKELVAEFTMELSFRIKRT